MRFALFLLSLVLLAACAAPAPPAGGSVPELKLVDLQVGSGPIAGPGMDATVHYTGWLYDRRAKDQRGEKFDSSRDRGQPFTFFLGGRQVIRGWDEGVVGMRVGGKRLLLVPAEYAYGSEGAGGVIPPNASLVFEVELLALRPR